LTNLHNFHLIILVVRVVHNLDCVVVVRVDDLNDSVRNDNGWLLFARIRIQNRTCRHGCSCAVRTFACRQSGDFGIAAPNRCSLKGTRHIFPSHGIFRQRLFVCHKSPPFLRAAHTRQWYIFQNPPLELRQLQWCVSLLYSFSLLSETRGERCCALGPRHLQQRTRRRVLRRIVRPAQNLNFGRDLLGPSISLAAFCSRIPHGLRRRADCWEATRYVTKIGRRHGHYALLILCVEGVVCSIAEETLCANKTSVWSC
jgi:hypothetical protein